MNKWLLIFGISVSLVCAEETKVLNIYAFGNYLPNKIIVQFTKETGIRVNLTECENNETLLTKLNTTSKLEYDLATISNFFLPQIVSQIQPLKIQKIANTEQIHPFFLRRKNNPTVSHNLPFCWGTTGLIVNKKYFNPNTITHWKDLWNPKFSNQLMILNDMRELFSIAMITLGYSVNDSNPEHIKIAYQKIVDLLPNIRLINLECVPNIYIDEDVTIGTAWSGDFSLAKNENPNLNFLMPEPGFVLWFDSFVILKNAPHLENAYKFLSFIGRPEIAQQIIENGYFSVNLQLINTILSPQQLDYLFKKGQIQHNLPIEIDKLYKEYWNTFRINN